MEISSTIKYIGVDDTDIDFFESQYPVPAGISYNSYVIFDEKIAVVDTADARKGAEWWSNLNDALAGRTPDYLLVQHMEPDHSSLIAEAMERFPAMQVVCTAKAVQMLTQFFETADTSRCIAVKEGDTLSLGNRVLRFLLAPMVHWPEVMVIYDEQERTLFSADAFGTFGALSNGGGWDDEARRYYINICGKYGAQVQALLKKVASLDIARICPLHGPVLSENLAHYVALYDTWSSYKPETEGVLVAYASIYGGTATTALWLADALRQRGANVITHDLCRCDVSLAVSDAFRLSRMLLCASSYDAGLFPPMHKFLHYLKIKGYQSRKVGILENGSWVPTAGRVMRSMLEEMKGLDVLPENVTIKSRMKSSDIPQLEVLVNDILL